MVTQESKACILALSCRNLPFSCLSCLVSLLTRTMSLSSCFIRHSCQTIILQGMSVFCAIRAILRFSEDSCLQDCTPLWFTQGSVTIAWPFC